MAPEIVGGGTTTTRKLGVAAAVLVVAVLLSRVLGLARDAFIAAAFGANGTTDAFYAAFTIPDILNYLVAGGTLSITFIPIYTRYLAAGARDEGDRVFSIVATVMGTTVIAAVAFLEWTAPEVAARYLRHLRPADLALGVELTRILLPAQLFFYLGGLASATLFARQRFVAAALAPLLYNAGTIAGGVLLGRRLGVASLAWGALAGAIVGPFAIQVVGAHRAGLRYRPRFEVRHPELRRWLALSLPLMVGVSLVTADEWFLRYFAAGEVGAISCLSYARKLVMVPIALAGQAVGQASMPFFARLHAEGRHEELGALVTRSARASGVVSALGAAGLLALATPLVELLFRRGAFGDAQVGPTATYLAIFAVAIPLWAVQGIVSRAFYATGDTWTPMVAGTTVTIVSVPIYALGYRWFGVIGLVVASDLGILMHTGLLLALVRRRANAVRPMALVLGVARGALLGAVAAVAAWGVARWVPATSLGVHSAAVARSVLGAAAFGAVTLALAKVLGVDDVAVLVARVVRRRPIEDSTQGRDVTP